MRIIDHVDRLKNTNHPIWISKITCADIEYFKVPYSSDQEKISL